MDYSSAFDAQNGDGNDTGKPPSGFGAFDAAEPAPEYKPIPPGIYVARVQRGEAWNTKAGADAYRMRFAVTEGPQAGNTVVRIWTFGEKAIRYTRRDLEPFGLTSTAKLLSPFPEPGREYHVRLTVALQRDNYGREFNDIKKIDLLRVEESPAAAFLLPEKGEGGPK